MFQAWATQMLLNDGLCLKLHGYACPCWNAVLASSVHMFANLVLFFYGFIYGSIYVLALCLILDFNMNFNLYKRIYYFKFLHR